MDGDFQNNPDSLSEMLKCMRETSIDLVSGWRKNREDSLKKKLPSLIANKFLNLVFQHSTKDLGCALRVFKKSCYLKLKFSGDFHRYLPILFYIHGFKSCEYPTQHRSRQSGESKYGLNRIPKVLRDTYRLLKYRKQIRG